MYSIIFVKRIRYMNKKSKKIIQKEKRKSILIDPEVHNKLKVYSAISKKEIQTVTEKAILKEIES